MNAQLVVALRVCRTQFFLEQFTDTDDILTIVGSGSFAVESEEGSFTVRENEAYVFHKNVRYHRRVLQPITLYLFRYKSDAPVFGANPVLFQDRQRLSTTLLMLDRLDEESFGEDFALRRHLFSDLLFQYQLQGSGAQSKDARIEAAMDEIRKKMHVGVCLEEIAARSGLSYVQFLRRFKACAGMTPSEYLRMLRIQKAKALLCDTPLRIKEIAAACGFENEYYFSNYFKARTDVSPSDFRAASRT